MRYICNRACYYDDQYYEVGDVLRDGMKPTKHFSSENSFVEKEDLPMQMYGDDPRSTAQIKSDIERKGETPVSNNRKELYSQWRSCKDQPDIKPKPIEEYTAEDIEKTTIKQFGKLYGVNTAGKTKAQVVESIRKMSNGE